MLTSLASHQEQQLSQDEKNQLADLMLLLRKINLYINDSAKTTKNITNLIEDFERQEGKINTNFKMKDIINSDLSFIAGALLGISENLGNENSITLFGSLMQYEKKNSELQQKKIIHTLEILISKGADVNIADSGSFPLFIASFKGNLGTVNFLLKQKEIEKSINRLSKDGVSSLFSASQRNHVGVVRALIDAGADVSSLEDNIPLRTASENGHLEIVKQLISDRVLSHYKDFVYTGQVSLYLASQNGHVKVVEELLTTGGLDLDYIHKRNNASAIHVATQNGHSEIVELFLERGANVNILSDLKSSPLHIASEWGHLEIVKTILKHDEVQINAENNSGGTALIFASQNGYALIVEALIEDKRLNSDYSKAITSALENNHFNIVEKLVKKSANSHGDLLASAQVESLKFNSFDSIMIYKSFKKLFEILEGDEKNEFLTAQIDRKTILEHAIENKNYEVAKLIYLEEISLLGAHKTEEELEDYNIKIVKKAFSNLINEVEFFEFIKLFIDDKDGEIFKLLKIEIPQGSENMNRELTDIWKLYREKDFKKIKSSILQDLEQITQPKYKESSVDQVQINPKTLLHRLAEDGSDECVNVIESIIKCLKLKRNPIHEVLNSRADIEYVDRKTKDRGVVKGVTALYLAVNNQNLKAIEALIEYSNFDCPIKKVDNAKTKTNYSILELALESASLKSVDLLKSTAILKILTGSNKFEKKAEFPKSEEQKNKIAEKFYSYPMEIQKILLESYPEENIKERADEISAMSSVGVEFSRKLPILERGMTSLRMGSSNPSSRLVDEIREEDLAGAKVRIRR